MSKHPFGAPVRGRAKRNKGPTRQGSARNRLWWRVYRGRMYAGLERCRNCRRQWSDSNELTMDHLVPAALGTRGLSFDNATILCRLCQNKKADRLWPHLFSLAKEEAQAAPDRRWYEIALVEDAAYFPHGECPVCGAWFQTRSDNGLVKVHGGLPSCPGSDRAPVRVWTADDWREAS